jgi:hypothetical protein
VVLGRGPMVGRVLALCATVTVSVSSFCEFSNITHIHPRRLPTCLAVAVCLGPSEVWLSQQLTPFLVHVDMIRILFFVVCLFVTTHVVLRREHIHSLIPVPSLFALLRVRVEVNSEERFFFLGCVV